MKFCGEGYIPRSNFWGGLHQPQWLFLGRVAPATVALSGEGCTSHSGSFWGGLHQPQWLFLGKVAPATVALSGEGYTSHSGSFWGGLHQPQWLFLGRVTLWLFSKQKPTVMIINQILELCQKLCLLLVPVLL